MSQHVRIREIAPDLRITLLPCFQPPHELRLPSGHSVRPSTQPVPGAPVYLTVTDRSQQVVMTGATSTNLSAELLRLVQSAATVDLLPLECAVVCVLDAWDRLFRELEIYDGNIYMASETAVARLLEVAGAPEVPTPDVVTALDDLQAVELVYRFPIARKFRGTFGVDNQCRLNGWGRRLAQNLPHPDAERWRSAIRDHLRAEGAAYRDLVKDLVKASDASGGELWNRVQSVPVSILV
jgi:hypothetical protein